MRNVLFISYYFPPSGGSGVQRSLKFVKYLPAYGWRPIVLTVRPDAAAYPDLDHEMPREVPEEALIYRTNAWDPYSLYARWTGKPADKAVTVGFLSDESPSWRDRMARWVRGNVFLPDARVGWVPFATQAGRKILAEHPIDVIYTTGPPHSTHLIGRKLKRLTNTPWVADFRDAWTDIDFKGELAMSAAAATRDAQMEASVLNEASRVISVTPSIVETLAEKTSVTCETIYNGFDAADLREKASPPDDTFVITHVGNMNSTRSPEALLRALATLRSEQGWKNALVRLVGNVDASVLDLAQRLGISDWVERVPYVPHKEAVRFMQESHVLLLVINRVPIARDIVTGKVFEYMATGRPVLGIGPPDGQAAAVIDDVGAGKMFDYEDDDALAQYLVDLRAAWQDWRPAHPDRVEAYSRKGQTGRLAAIFDTLAGG